MKGDYQWQGEPVSVKFGYCKVTIQTEPMWWSNYECDKSGGKAQITAVQITAPGIDTETGEPRTFCIANEFGEGIAKLKNGGWPGDGHASLPDAAFIEDRSRTVLDYNKLGWKVREKQRRDWQLENWPDEFEKMEALREMIQRFR